MEDSQSCWAQDSCGWAEPDDKTHSFGECCIGFVVWLEICNVVAEYAALA